MLKKLKDILNTYENLDDIELWINSNDQIKSIIIDDYNIDLITSESEIKINDLITSEKNDIR